MPLWIAFVALVGAALLWIVLTVIVRLCAAKCNKNTSDLGEPDENENEELKMSGTEPQTLAENVEVQKNPFVKRRLKSLDTFRGIAITLMIFVNYGGGGYYFFGHAVWNGLLVADLVFPWFLWIMGVSITLSFRVLRLRRVSKIKIASKILKRSLILFGLGLFTSNCKYKPNSLWIAFAALVGAALLWVVLTVIVRLCAAKCNKNTSELSEPDENENEELKMSGTEPQTLAENVEVEKNPFVKRRLKSLDTFRGCLSPFPLGLLVADLVFPWFLWIMGVSITLSFRVLRLRRVSKIKIASKILKRSLILFGLGLFTSNYGNLEFYRIPGVLQRFGVCYLFVAMMQLLLRPTDNEDRKGRWWHKFRDVYGLWKQWIFVFVVLAAYLALTFGVDVPGCPKGYLGPGGIGQGFPNASNCTGGMAGYIDRIALGKHIYRLPTIKELYKTSLPFDPEGILGCLPSIVLVFFGVQVIRSLSFISATGASSFLLFAVCYLLTDVLGWWNGAPFLYPGMNSILLYVGHGILWRHLPFSWEMDKYAGHGEMLAMNITGTALWCLIAYYLFTKNVFLKV
ncbi:PREDICTED: heparan-alpha-glucosaminide N-acetyltransferase-like [Acropora digitifera]|uniref:heparan-alpha-glucosaminide N-acetyltransferase-like n=1 Tax=Acropora digitifera TaxID=70779 RepID=UPI00077A3B21|nr:PREDICTED: heparan-alpha-glucosaminide N-acetyltransferase-like [Acropora digitifera]